MFIEPGKTSIRTVRATGRAPDRLALRLRLEGALSGLELRPAGLPAAAIFCVRTLHTAFPRAWQRPTHDVRLQRAWERAMTRTLEQLLQRAARPAHGAVPDNAEAVLFADYAELLACLAADWCAGNVSTRWWWHSLLRQAVVDRAVLQAWRATPPYVPAALHSLARRRQVVPFVRALSCQEAESIVHSLTQWFALPALRTVLESMLGDAPHQAVSLAEHPAVTSGPTPPDSPRSTVRREHSRALEAPWQPWVPESTDQGLSLAQQCLLGLGLMLQRAPTVVRASTFATTLLQWWHTTPHPTVSPDLTTRFSTMPLPAGPSAFEAQEGRVTMPPTTQGEDSTAVISSLQRQESTISPEATPALAGLTPPGPEVASIVPPAGHHQTPREATTPVPPASHSVLASTMPADSQTPEAWIRPGTWRDVSRWQGPDSQTPEAWIRPGTQIETALGGVFYLINLGLCLQLYGDFTAPAHPGLPLSVWDFIALLGQQLVGDTICADPVWPLLAHLAGRTAFATPGENFQPPAAWRLPEAWLKPFPTADLWHCDTAHGRLRVQHPEQFLVLDVPGDASNLLQQLQEELLAYSATSTFEIQYVALASGLDGTSPLERWLAWLMPYVRARLQCALGLADTDDLGRVVCEHQARVCVSATHLDIFLALETLPIAIRFAGLDRDPGWVPAAGRYIAFHFE